MLQIYRRDSAALGKLEVDVREGGFAVGAGINPNHCDADAGIWVLDAAGLPDEWPAGASS
jgi:hypothetical protein